MTYELYGRRYNEIKESSYAVLLESLTPKITEKTIEVLFTACDKEVIVVCEKVLNFDLLKILDDYKEQMFPKAVVSISLSEEAVVSWVIRRYELRIDFSRLVNHRDVIFITPDVVNFKVGIPLCTVIDLFKLNYVIVAK